MHTFQVWAPLPQKVELALEGARLPMTRDSAGWWTLTAPLARPGSNYGFWLDDAGPFPDPRSPFQPEGVHGRSRLVDHSAFAWTDPDFEAPALAAAVFYEMHIGTFTPAGTFRAAVEKLDHLVRLGITHIEVMPVAHFPGHRGWGYDGVDLFAPHLAYGGPEGLKEFVNACHARGLAVVMDVVFNHLGPSGNYLARFAPYFHDRYHTPWGWAVNFDGPDSDPVRRFFCDNALMWLRDYHCDGLRLDAVHAIFDSSARHFLEQLGDEVQELSRQSGRRLVVIAESDLNDPRLLWPRDRGGFALDAQWSDDFHHALHAVLTGDRAGYYQDFGTLAHLAKALQQAFVYDGLYSAYRRRRHGRSPVGLEGSRFLGYAQNHDQVGNRAKGERLCHLVNSKRQKIAAGLVLTAPFVPMLFQGEEWGATAPFQYFTDHQEPHLAQAVEQGRYQEFAAFGWPAAEVPNPQSPETFENSKLDWSELAGKAHAEMLNWYRELIQLRQREPELREPDLTRLLVRFDEAAGWLVLERGRISVVLNLADHPQAVPVRAGEHQVLLTSPPEIAAVNAAVSMPPDGIALLKLAR